jgi:hypothetical protein
MRIIFGPEHSGRRQEGIILLRRMILTNSANTRSEPICFQGTVATAQFSGDGKKVMTLSGGNLNVLDSIRIWSAPLSDPPPDTDKYQFTGENPPSWLADLAGLVSGLEDCDAMFRLSEYTAKKVQDEYEKIWQRFEPILEEDW